MVVGVRLIRKINAVIAQIRRFLYNMGNEFVGVTGGWNIYGWSGLSAMWVGSGGSITKLSDAIRITMLDTGATGQSGALRVVNKVTLSNINTLKIKLSYSLGQVDTASGGYQRLYLFVSSVSSGDWTTPSVYDAINYIVNHTASTNLIVTGEEHTLDVSGLPDGDYYVCLGYVWRYQNISSWVEMSVLEKY